MDKFKKGVKINGIKPEMLFAHMMIKSIFQSYGYPTIITSGVEGQHNYASLHYVGFALDYRIKHLSDGVAELILSDMKEALTDEFDIVLARTHIHVEFQPKDNHL